MGVRCGWGHVSCVNFYIFRLTQKDFMRFVEEFHEEKICLTSPDPYNLTPKITNIEYEIEVFAVDTPSYTK